MTLSRQSISPTANLLRNSRLFSLPNPLPRPTVSENFRASVIKASDTATLPYPTHQAIATTKPSLARGDWGLKRPIPSRSHLVQVSDPVLRVTQLDTIEHVTDFDSAADHVRTRQKWEEMGVPLMKGMTQMRNPDFNGVPPSGAFEIRDDTTHYDTDMGLDEAGLYLKALKNSMPSERAKAEWETFHAQWKGKWEEKKASWTSRGWGEQLTDFESAQEKAKQGRRQLLDRHKRILKRESKAFRTHWATEWAAKKADWEARGLSSPEHPERAAEATALKKQVSDAAVALRKRWVEEKASLAGKTPARMPWLVEFTAFEQEQEDAKRALRQQIAATPFAPLNPPPVDPVVHNTRRWKHDGPWLPGMSADDFVAYLSKEISARKKEFKAYLTEYVKSEIYTSRRLAAKNNTEDMPPLDSQEAEAWQATKEKEWRNISPSEIEAGIKTLRKETASDPLSSKLVRKLIFPFLRVPTIKLKHSAYAMDESRNDVNAYHFDQELAPLSTHPSAGLGYLRTKSYITNHPILGPQAKPAPITARILQARRTAAGRQEAYAKFGVAGFVANDQYRNTGGSYQVGAKDVETLDVDTPGGRKVFVQPLFASVSNDGRVHVKIMRSTGPEVDVARGELDDRPPARETMESDPLRNLGSMGRSGVKELDEMSGEAAMLNQYLRSGSDAGSGMPSEGFPGVSEALRGE
ncbi:Mitochondrial ribosomal MRP51 [Pyrenophora seminiperda CCB06]|uniref:Mitochondrial ribosomal MRP51 n=1 Tax=Pyrenophora seminiperda CCB06 TaxID=1302712 RepID=A0A3M7MFW1_9PLEO|nr:Mitochondrial ribosomal MRP51 [Pyrenophora seminiperda CCB06]